MIWFIACSDTMTSAPTISVGASAAAEEIFICEGLTAAADPVQQEAATAAGPQESAAGPALAQESAAWAQVSAARAQESAARAQESAARAQESAARAQESAARAFESAIRAFEGNMVVQTQYYQKLLQK